MEVMPKLSKKVMTKSLAMLVAVGLSCSVFAMDVSDLPYTRDAYDELYLNNENVDVYYDGDLYYDVLNYPLVTYEKAYSPKKKELNYSMALKRR